MPTSAFRTPAHPIIATHFQPHSWAPDFWCTLNLQTLDAELADIHARGFNTVIILVPWVGFQPQVRPIQYHQEYLDLFDALLARIQAQGLLCILRIGYAHEGGIVSYPDSEARQFAVFTDEYVHEAWRDYLCTLWAIVKNYDCVLGGFLTWEDFFFLNIVHHPLNARLRTARQSGYQEFLKQNYSLEEINALYPRRFYQFKFRNYQQIPVPSFKSPAMKLWSQFWDQWLTKKLLAFSREHFPPLSFEVRVDCEPFDTPQQTIQQYVCHKDTFDVDADTDITFLYYSPAWGSDNTEKFASAETALYRLRWMLETVRQQTQNALFIDQFNFIDNTPEFTHNTAIDPQHLNEFLVGATELLKEFTVGFGLWALHDIPTNILRNGSFLRDYAGWEVNEFAEWVEVLPRHAVKLATGGKLSQQLDKEYHSTNSLYQLDFQVCSAEQLTTPLQLRLKIVSARGQVMYQREIHVTAPTWKKVHFQEVPFKIHAVLSLENSGASVLAGEFMFHAWHQENGVLDVDKNPKDFYPAFQKMMQQLQAQPVIPAYYSKAMLTPENFSELYPEQWMSHKISGQLSTNLCYGAFFIRAYVPEHWENYCNQLSLQLGETHIVIATAVFAGYNEIIVPLPTKISYQTLNFVLESSELVSPKQYDVGSQDARLLSLQLLGLGFCESGDTLPPL